MSNINLDALAARLHERIAEAVGEEAEILLDESSRIVPLAEGILQDSGRTAQDGTTSAVGPGSGPAAAYAVRQHEELGYTHDAGRQAKYLEVPFMASRAGYLQRLAEAAKEVLS
jgi:hypothetical protein